MYPYWWVIQYVRCCIRCDTVLIFCISVYINIGVVSNIINVVFDPNILHLYWWVIQSDGISLLVSLLVCDPIRLMCDSIRYWDNQNRFFFYFFWISKNTLFCVIDCVNVSIIDEWFDLILYVSLCIFIGEWSNMIDEWFNPILRLYRQSSYFFIS